MSPARSFARSRVTSIDIATGEMQEPTGALAVPAPRRAHVVIRFHGHPIGDMNLSVGPDTNFLETARQTTWHELRDELNYHLERDGLTTPQSIEDLAALPSGPCKNPLDVAPDIPPFLTVAIATVGNEDACIKTVDRVLESTYPRFEIVVVDNTPGATNLETTLKQRVSDERVRYAHETRKGLSFARNRGLAEARGEIVVFTDDDVIVDPGWLFAIARGFASDSEVACVTGSILAAEIETPAQAWLEQYGGYNKGFRTQVYDLKENRRSSALYPYDAGRFGSGANIALRADALRAMGGFAVDLGAGTPAHGGEDIDILRRVITSKHRLVYEPAALMWHHHRRAYPALRKQMYRYGVGLSATVTKWMLEDPRTALAVLSRLPAGARHILSPKSQKNARKTAYYPPQLTWLERAGLAAGPFLYLRSRAVVRGRK